jgi:anti-sigma regulatory factor (Ser/Thr protein kinase)
VEALIAPVEDIAWIPVEDESAPGSVRRAASALARRVGFSEHRAGEVAIAATELASNLHKHAVSGAVLLRLRRSADDVAVELVVVDGGPGVLDLAASAEDGRSTGGTLGIGLGAAMRLASWFDSHSVVGRGTVMVATFWRTPTDIARPAVAALTRPMAGELVCGDACAYRTDGSATSVLLVDGLGHGEIAAIASRAAVRAFIADDGDAGPARTLQRIDEAMRATRGAAGAIARVDRENGTLTFAGIGNVAAWLDDGEKRRALVSAPGILGANQRPAREVTLPLPPQALIVLHSDGLSSKWDLDAYPGLRSRDPHLVAATLIRDAGVRRDDASVAVARAS